MATKHDYVGVFAADCEHDEPVAMFTDADEAQRYRRQRFGDRGLVAPVDASAKMDAGLREAVRAMRSPAVSPAAGSADDVRRGEIRARLEAEERDKRLEAEVRREMSESSKSDSAAERSADKAAAEAAEAREKQAEAQRQSDEARSTDTPAKPGR